MTTPYLISDIKSDEGLRTKPYPDPLTGGAPWTVGYGHTGTDVAPGVSWPPGACERALAVDVGAVQRALDAALPWWRTLNDARQDVLVNMGYNMGVAKLLTFKITLSNIQEGDYAQASVGMLQSLWASQVASRARRLAKQMETGERQCPT